MGYRFSFGKKIALLLALFCLWNGGVSPLNSMSALAKKKAKEVAPAAPAPDPVAVAEAKLGKDLAPINDQLTKVMMKLEGRVLLSPTEAGQLVELKYQLLDFLNANPQSLQLAKPLYQAGVIFSQREEFNDAYELFNYLAQGFPTTTYGMKAKGQMQQLEKRFGPNYFAVEAAVTPTTTPITSPTGSAPAAATPTSNKPAPKK